MSVLVSRIDKVLGDDAAGHLQTGDISVEAAAHLGACESAGGTKLTGDETALLLECKQNCFLDTTLRR